MRLYLLVTFALLANGCADDDPASKQTLPSTSTAPSTPTSGGGIWFTDESQARGVDFTLDTSIDPAPFLPEIVAGGGGAIDYDDDGWMDLYLVQASGAGGNRLLHNNGDGTFTDATATSNAADAGYGMGVATGDANGDGLVDLYVTNLGANVLLLNSGDGTFINATETSGTGHPGLGASATFTDADRDGDLDLVVTNYVDWAPEREITCLTTTGSPDYCPPVRYASPTTDVLYRNEGNGRFTDVSAPSGLTSAPGTGLGIVARDFTGDGLPDLFIANDGMPDRLWVNLGDLRFEDRAMAMGCDRDLSGTAKAGMGVAGEDLDADGDIDLLVCNLIGESDSVFRNDGTRFTDITSRSGLAATSRRSTRFGVVLADFDNDGLLDLYEANGRVGLRDDTFSSDPYAEPDMLLKGTGSGRFAEVPGGLDDEARTSRALVVLDADNDGGLDLLVIDRQQPARLLMNRVPDRGHWAMLDIRDIRGAPALGASVVATIGDRLAHRTVHADGSYLAAADHRVHLGLGGNDRVAKVEITWPDERSLILTNLEADRVHLIHPPGDE